MLGVFETHIKFGDFLELNKLDMDEIVYHRGVCKGISYVTEDTDVIVRYDNGDMSVFIPEINVEVIVDTADSWKLPRHNWELII